MEIISKFTIGSDEGVDDLFTVIKSSVKTMYKELVSEEEITQYIENWDPRKMINELNNLSNQLIVTYAGQKPVGYGIVKSGSGYPGSLEGKRFTELNFVILKEYDTPETRSSLWKKCKTAASFTDIIWTNILTEDPLLEFLKETGFVIKENSKTTPFQLPSYIVEMQVSKN
ncbi:MULTISPECIES: hypothetical protein [unclassified Chryseobacterium]|uniref:hypothetical protein n=1 Tax=unclassified Chryseobacterium TaxID=2593645 RepID=UPI00100ABBB5|nr:MULTISPECIES: hypothetical protein [unclassified Chryseobacterium]RXM50450.1 hypothetical protein BOQ64_18715 [Chryseobacterium sp. CH25]RXM64590.1 hypothetical protein BOQ60_10210 [Chryseobacterium sp. CH1]